MGCGARLFLRVLLLVLLVALVPAGYLTYQYYLKDWGRDRLAAYARTVADATNATPADAASLPQLSGALVDGVACVKCPGVNNVYPITATTHPTYGGFQKTLINDGGWITSMLVTIGVAVGGGGSLVLALLYAVAGSSAAVFTARPMSSTAQNGCGIFEMVFLLSQAQFITLLGALHLDGTPRFFLEFAKKLAWTNLQIFPPETSYKPTVVDVSSAVAGSSRRRLSVEAAANATGIERYALLVGAEPRHFFYYTCAALALALAAVLVVYVLLRVLLAGCKKRDAAAALDHRVIWVFLLLLMLAQYVVAMSASFQIYWTATESSSATSDYLLAVVVLGAACVGLVAFGVIKVARHRDAVDTHGSPAHDATHWFHLRYSVFYQDYTLENLYFFVAKMALDIAAGAVVGTVHDGPLQIAVLVALNAAFLAVLIWRQPFLVPLFYFVAVLAGYLRLVLLLLALVQSRSDVFPQDARDFVAALTIAVNAVLLICILIRQFYVLCVAILRWASRSKQRAIGDEELGIPLQDMEPRVVDPRKNRAASSDHASPMPAAAAPLGSASSSRASTKLSSSKSASQQRTREAPISDATLFASQPYHAMNGDDDDVATARPSKPRRSKRDRHSLPGYSSATSTDGSTTAAPAKGGGRRSLYTRRARRHREMLAVKSDELPDWAKV